MSPWSKLRSLVQRLHNWVAPPHLTPIPESIARPVSSALRAARWVAVAAAVALLAFHYWNGLLAGGYEEWFDANAEGTPWTWASGLAAGIVAAGALLGAAVLRSGRRALLLLAIGAGFFSMDDMISFHERLSWFLLSWGGLSSQWDSIIWPVVYAPAMIVTAILILRVSGSGTAGTLRASFAGLALLGGAVVLEVVSAPWSEGVNTIHTLEGGIEEAAELAGWILMAAGVLLAVVVNIVRQANHSPAEPAAVSPPQDGHQMVTLPDTAAARRRERERQHT